ncbi:hypothetical protein [Undibacterium sp.]|uniref:hypothetical protein n=1 Tax=Undibacterium sp. TaxID=1914977 RepID=UPI0025E4512A|nr:hypothetical protein [Undibacterium sp.]
MVTTVFLRNLNVFVAFLALSLAFLAGPLLMFIAFVASSVFKLDSRIGFFFIPMIPVVFGIVLGTVWFKRGLVPIALNPSRLSRHSYGHRIVAIGTALEMLSFLVPVVASFLGVWVELSYHADGRQLLQLFRFVGPTGIVCSVMGLFLIWSARA